MSEKRFLFRWAGWYLFLNFFLFVALMSRYLSYAGRIEDALSLFYTPLVLSGHVASLLFISFLIFFLPLILFYPKRKLVFLTGLIVLSLGVILICIDFEVYSQYRFHLNRMVISLMLGAGSEIFVFPAGMYLYGVTIIAGIFLFEALLVFFAKRFSQSPIKSPWIRWGTALLALFAFVGSHLIHAWANAAYYRPVVSITRHLPLYKPLTARRFMEKYGFADLERNREVSRLKEKGGGHAVSYPVSPLTFGERKSLSNILFIVVDSMRYDMITADIMPNTKGFLDRTPSILFENHWSGGNGTWTGIFTLFYGIFGSYWTVMENEQIGPLFIHTLIDKKYQMGIFASSKLTAPAFNQTVFREIENLRTYSDGKTAWERDRDAAADWKTWFEQRKKEAPFFSFLFFDAAHAYSPPPNYKRPFNPSIPEAEFHKLSPSYDPMPFLNLYKNALHFVDSLIGEVLNQVAVSGALDSTVIVITSDHGQEFNDNGKNFWGHGSNFTRYQLRVPLAIVWPGKDAGRFSHVSTHVDIVPTLMREVLECQNPMTDYSNGRSLFDTSPRTWIYAGGTATDAIVETDRITETNALGDYEIYDLSNRVIKEGTLRSNIIQAVLKEKSRFFQRESPNPSSLR